MTDRQPKPQPDGTAILSSPLGTIRPIERDGKCRWVWTDARGRESAPLPTLPEARVFAERHRRLR